MPHVISLESFVVPARLSQKYHQVVNQLTVGEGSHGMHLERLCGQRSLLSIRFNRCDRLLVHAFYDKGECCYLVLAIVEHHRYDKNPFVFDKQFLSRYLRTHQNEIAAKLQCAKENVLSLEAQETVPVEIYNNQLISPSAEQQAVYSALSQGKGTAKLLLGPPGSGKTWLAKMLIEGEIDNALRNEDAEASDNALKTVIYVAPTEPLARQMQAMVSDRSVSEGQVHCMTYHHLMVQILALPGEVVGDEHLRNWLESYISSQVRMMKTRYTQERRPAVVDANEIDRIIKEFYIISGYEVREPYFSCGRRQSYYADQVDRQWLYEAFWQYQSVLALSKQIHLGFYRVDEACLSHTRLIVDEAQGLSYRQLCNLYALSDGQCIFLADPNQYLNGHITNIGFIKRHLVGQEGCYQLDNTSHRCARNIVQVANNVLSLRSSVFGGNIDGAALACLSENAMNGEGCVGHYPNKETLQHHQPHAALDQASCAIVTLEAFREEAQAKFVNPLVFTVEEIGGLDYETLVLYKLFDLTSIKFLTQHLEQGKPLLIKENLPKFTEHTAEQEQMVATLNQWFVACSRARSQLFIVQQVSARSQVVFSTLLAHTQNVATEFVACLDTSQQQKSYLEASTTPEVLLQQWRTQYQRLLEQGRIAQANNVMATKIMPLEQQLEPERREVVSLTHDAEPQRSVHCGSMVVVKASKEKSAVAGPRAPSSKKNRSKQLHQIKAVQPLAQNWSEAVDSRALFEKPLPVGKMPKSIKAHFMLTKSLKPKLTRQWLLVLAKMLQHKTISNSQRSQLGRYLCKNYIVVLKGRTEGISPAITKFVLPKNVLTELFKLDNLTQKVLVTSGCLHGVITSYSREQVNFYIDKMLSYCSPGTVPMAVCSMDEVNVNFNYEILQADGTRVPLSELLLDNALSQTQFDRVFALMRSGVNISQSILFQLINKTYTNSQDEIKIASFISVLVKEVGSSWLQTQSGDTPLIEAIKQRKLYIASELIKLMDIEQLNYKGQHQYTAMHYAAFLKFPEILEKLANRGAAIDELDASGRTPLSHVAEQHFLQGALILLNNGADVSGRDDRSTYRPHYYAIKKQLQKGGAPSAEYVEVLRILVLSGANFLGSDAQHNEAYLHYVENELPTSVDSALSFSLLVKENYELYLKTHCHTNRLTEYLDYLLEDNKDWMEVVNDVWPSMKKTVFEAFCTAATLSKQEKIMGYSLHTLFVECSREDFLARLFRTTAIACRNQTHNKIQEQPQGPRFFSSSAIQQQTRLSSPTDKRDATTTVGFF